MYYRWKFLRFAQLFELLLELSLPFWTAADPARYTALLQSINMIKCKYYTAILFGLTARRQYVNQARGNIPFIL